MHHLGDLLVAFFVAALSGMGVGGGGLLVIYLTLIRNMEQVQAQGVNLLFFLVASGASLLLHFQKRKLNIRLIVFLCFFGILGSIAGSAATSLLHPFWLRKIFAVFLIVCGVVVFCKKKKKR